MHRNRLRRAARAAPPRRAAALATLAALLVVAGCGDGGPGGAAPGAGGGGNATGAQPGGAAPGAVAPAAPEGPVPQFVDVLPGSGIVADNHSGKPAKKDWIVSGMGGGSILFDYDGDGDMDVLIVDGTMLTSEGELQYDDAWRTRLFRNDGALKFTDVTAAAGIDIRAFGFGGASCDYDADGDLDFYVCTWGRNFLMRNRGDGTFEDVTDAAGVRGADDDMSTCCSWGDVNGDGRPDLYVSNYIDQWKFIRECQEHKPEPLPGLHCEWRGFRVYCGPPGLTPQPDRLYFAREDGTFEDVSATNLVDQDPRYAFQSVMTDVDNDGDLDIYVANDTRRNCLWINDGHGRFQDLGLASGCGLDADMKEQAGMGVDVADVNRDGLLDIFVTNFSHDFNTLYVNTTRKADAPVFKDLSHIHNVSRLSYLSLCWGTKLFDMDCDADLDMLVACGHVYGEIDNFTAATGTSYAQKPLLLRNQGPPRFKFEDVGAAAGPGMQIARVWRGAIFGDLDDDGDVDVLMTELNGTPALMRNDGGNTNAFLRFRLVRKDGMPDPPGARVIVTLEPGVSLLAELHHGASFCSDNDPRLHFGAGSRTSVPQVEVVWPDGSRQTFRDVATRKLYRVRQGQDTLEADGPLSPPR